MKLTHKPLPFSFSPNLTVRAGGSKPADASPWCKSNIAPRSAVVTSGGRAASSCSHLMLDFRCWLSKEAWIYDEPPLIILIYTSKLQQLLCASPQLANPVLQGSGLLICHAQRLHSRRPRCWGLGGFGERGETSDPWGASSTFPPCCKKLCSAAETRFHKAPLWSTELLLKFVVPGTKSRGQGNQRNHGNALQLRQTQ